MANCWVFDDVRLSAREANKVLTGVLLSFILYSEGELGPRPTELQVGTQKCIEPFETMYMNLNLNVVLFCLSHNLLCPVSLNWFSEGMKTSPRTGFLRARVKYTASSQRSGEGPFRHTHQKSYNNSNVHTVHMHTNLSDHQTKIPCQRSSVRTSGACVSRIWELRYL